MIKKKNQTLEEAIKSNKETTDIIDPSDFSTKYNPSKTHFTPDEILGNLTEVVGLESERYKKKARSGVSLTDKEVRVIGNLAITAQTLCEEQREQIKMAKFDKMNEEELLQHLKQALLNFPEEKYIQFIGSCLEQRPIKD